jgi:hypothetical protein
MEQKARFVQVVVVSCHLFSSAENAVTTILPIEINNIYIQLLTGMLYFDQGAALTGRS